jgi:hypothetical protein
MKNPHSMKAFTPSEVKRWNDKKLAKAIDLLESAKCYEACRTTYALIERSLGVLSAERARRVSGGA